MVQKKTIIRAMLSSLLLLIFALCVTPKIVLHDMVADHMDTSVHLNDPHTEQLDKISFQCNCDSLVVESPFTHSLSYPEFIAPVVFHSIQDVFLHSYLSHSHILFGLRGPPAVV